MRSNVHCPRGTEFWRIRAWRWRYKLRSCDSPEMSSGIFQNTSRKILECQRTAEAGYSPVLSDITIYTYSDISPFSALIDSGSSHCFIDTVFVQKQSSYIFHSSN